MEIKINNLYKKFEKKVIFENFNISFNKDAVNIILGKSGCGKTTLLKIISGIIKKDSGEIFIGDSNEISYIFQEDRLVEWLTVKENIKLVIKNDYKKNELDGICEKYLTLVGIEDCANYYPQKLSGGMRQRVNIARAFAKPSKIIIMDEPFKSIDIKNKVDIMLAFNKVLQKENRTVLFVTHDIDEAFFLKGKIYVLGGTPTKVIKEFKNNQELDKNEIIALL
ncbi:NitT/TauT family transport system ATP-binding protein [Clostridium cavendishii DSM 21758]|uniref:NitT/TauT family transport system ATP-binding protein n=1 Tax=Clostridium cavendishii DSM 21758 TaxID=1121302 RepID=A0A1M6RXW1_9CLOT|nr:ABC transporter ATP-binding protein [Clostridium cavendishii]SHK37314.1 NitT/TauT family transport system ATP-binding protein [Clostridium cavendishii DSM 21758]